MADNMLLEKWGELIDAQSKKTKIVENREAMAQLLENEESYIVNEANSVSDMAQYTPILVPAVRRIMPNLLANEIVGVQPISAPTGYAYALRYTYGKDSVQSSTERGKWDRQLNGAEYAGLQNKGAAFILASNFTGSIGDTVTANGVDGIVIHAEYNKVLVTFVSPAEAATAKAAADLTVGQDTIAIAHAMNNEAGFNLIFSNYANLVSTTQAETLGMPGNEFKEMRMGLERVSVEVMTRALKAEYSIELAQDLKAVHGLDAEAELINILEYEITAELDRELVQLINNKATQAPAWTYGAVGIKIGDNNAGVSADGRWEMEKFRTLYTRIVREANQIALMTRRGSGNFIIASSNVISALETMQNFMYASVPGDVKPSLGVAKVGTIDGKFTVYMDSFATTDYVTIGYRGAGQFDTGVIYCPYVPLMLQKVTDPDTFQPKLAFKTRDAIVGNLFGVSNYYRTFRCDFTGSSLAGGYNFGNPNY